MEIVSNVLYVVGSAFVLIGGIGVLRFGDFLSRTHAAAKAPTLGLILVALGTALDLGTGLAIVTMILVVLLQLFTTPVGTHMLARASHGTIDIELDGPDELAIAKLREAGTVIGIEAGTEGDAGDDAGRDQDGDVEPGGGVGTAATRPEPPPEER